MKILVVGSGGREHALAWKLSQEAQVIVAPGNPGISNDVHTEPVEANDFPGLLEVARRHVVDLVVIGPEDPLIAGLADFLRAEGFPVFGPSKAAAQLEASKAFSKALMHEAGIPTAPFQTFTDSDTAKEYVREKFVDGTPVAVKASGNALGKGVIVADTEAEAEHAIDTMMVEKAFGAAGETVIIEDRLSGPEFSLLTIVGDHNFVSLPVAQDHKPVGDGNTGPNTGGMGTISPVPWVTLQLVKETEDRVVAPILAALKSRGLPYRGLLFSGLMMGGGRVHCLEFNVRFGDPETQTVMMRLGAGLAQALFQSATGLRIDPPKVIDNAAITVVIASGGYPAEVQKGLPIELPSQIPVGVKIFHAGTGRSVDGKLVTAGGRVFGVSALADNMEGARSDAYQVATQITFPGAFYRTDLGLSPTIGSG